ncbi:peptidoglycan recognition family protein [Streptomyces sp. NPDC057638]|uniref:peptidoglycan recognition protein family protein n=1 Tax=Streptomyces sp. NPDC057638 TaxID=3346190 RepID=UPI00368CA391
MKLVRRAQWGAPATSPAASIARTRGVKVHYLGKPYSSRAHGRCDDEVRAVRAAHLAHPTENYSDIAYNMLVCEHGYVYEGRGAHRRTGANGTGSLNSQDYAVCALLGSEGMTTPPDAMLHGIRDAIEYLRREGDAGNWIGGHRDGFATACPGGPLYAWVRKGAPRPGGTAPALPVPSTPVPPQETDVPRVIDTNNPIDTRLTAGRWTLLALPDEGGEIVSGPSRYDIGVHLSVKGLPPGTRVQGRFHRYLPAKRDRSDRRPQNTYADQRGEAEFRFTDAGTLAKGTELRFEVLADAPGTLIHRAINGVYWPEP